jgi:hypothetical protein
MVEDDAAEPRRFRLVALDIDGTLLDPMGQLTPATLNAVRAVELVGVTVALATSRRWTPAAPFAAQLWPAAPADDEAPTQPRPPHTLILCDGALVRSYPDGKLLQTALLPAAVAQAAAVILARQGFPVTAQYADATDASREYLVADVDPAHPEWSASYLNYYRYQTTFAPVAELCAGRPDALRLMAFGPVERLRALADELALLGCGVQIIAAGMYDIGELMVFAASASKGAAFSALAERLGVALAETLAIGDGVNDASLLRMAGLGVAMGNAVPEARAAADAVTAPNSADGAAQALDRYILTPEWTALSRLSERQSVH